MIFQITAFIILTALVFVSGFAVGRLAERNTHDRDTRKPLLGAASEPQEYPIGRVIHLPNGTTVKLSPQDEARIIGEIWEESAEAGEPSIVRRK